MFPHYSFLRGTHLVGTFEKTLSNRAGLQCFTWGAICGLVANLRKRGGLIEGMARAPAWYVKQH